MTDHHDHHHEEHHGHHDESHHHEEHHGHHEESHHHEEHHGHHEEHHDHHDEHHHDEDIVHVVDSDPIYVSNKGMIIVETVCKLSLLILAIVFFTTFPPYERSIAWEEYMRHKPVFEESVPVWMAMLINALIAIFWLSTVIGVNIYLQKQHHIRKKAMVPRILKAFLSLANSVLTTWAIVEPLKRFASEPRPHFLARCYGSVDNIPLLTEIPELLTNDMCYDFNQTAGNPYEFADRGEFDKAMNEDRLSFPSAHSAFTASIFLWMGYYFWWLTQQTDMYGARVIASSIMVALICPTVFIATSRVRDQWHYTWDVASGLLIGALIALWQFSSYYPQIDETDYFTRKEGQYGTAAHGKKKHGHFY